MVREETWEAFVADSLLYAKVCDYDLCDFDLCETFADDTECLCGCNRSFLLGFRWLWIIELGSGSVSFFQVGSLFGLQLINIKNKSFF